MIAGMDRHDAWIVASIALGSAVGGLGRYWCSGLVARWTGEAFPWGTIAVNVLGSFLIGTIAVVTGPDGRLLVGTAARQGMMIGVLGGFTTFSSFSLQTLTLLRDGEWLYAGANVGLSVALCLVGTWLGFVVGYGINR
jgi:CrcB protein